MSDDPKNYDAFFDGCHRYGWLITIIVNVVAVVFFLATTYQKLEDLQIRVGRLEMQWDRYLHETRGIELKGDR